jgi:MFS family permease
MRDLLRDRRFRLLFVGQTTSMLGDSLLMIVLAIWMKDLTGSSSAAGAVMLAVVAPMLASPLLGWVADRLRRRPFVTWTNILSGLALLPLLAVHDPRQAWVIYLVAACYGLSLNLNSAGVAGLIKHLVPEEQLGRANGTLASAREGLRLGGPLAGAGIYALLGARPVVFLDLASFVACAAAVAAIRLDEHRPRRQTLHWLTEVTGGFRHLTTSPPLRSTTTALAAAVLVFGTLEAGIFAYVDHGLHRPAAFVGVLTSCMGFGSLLGGLLAPKVIDRIGEPGTVAAGLAAMAVGLGPLLYPNAAAGMAAIPLLGLGVSFAIVGYATLRQRTTPQDLLGRVSTATDLLIGAPQTLSIAAGAVLVAHVDYRWIFAVASVGLLATAAGLWTGQLAQDQVSRRSGAAGEVAVCSAEVEAPGDMRGSPHGAQT